MSEHMLILECEVGQPVIDNGSPIPISRHILGLEAHHASQKGFLKAYTHTNATEFWAIVHLARSYGRVFFFSL
jgi:hypothetical protein